MNVQTWVLACPKSGQFGCKRDPSLGHLRGSHGLTVEIPSFAVTKRRRSGIFGVIPITVRARHAHDPMKAVVA